MKREVMIRGGLFLLFYAVWLLVFSPLTPSTADNVQGVLAFGYRSSTFAALSTPANGQVRYCSNCAATSPCTSGGGGAVATRVGGAWNCSTGGGGAASGERLLSSTTFDVDSGAAQTLYTVPTGKSVLVTRALLRSSSVPLDSGGSGQIVVTAAGTTAFTLSLAAMTTNSRANWQLRASGVFVSAAAGSLITATVDAPYGSAATAVIELYGVEY